MTLHNESTNTLSTHAIDLSAIVGRMPRQRIVVGIADMAVSSPGAHFGEDTHAHTLSETVNEGRVGVFPALRVTHLWRF